MLHVHGNNEISCGNSYIRCFRQRCYSRLGRLASDGGRIAWHRYEPSATYRSGSILSYPRLLLCGPLQPLIGTALATSALATDVGRATAPSVVKPEAARPVFAV